jgi:hypothetical protein
MPEAHLDGVPTAPRGEQPEHGGLAEGGVHAEFQGDPPAELGAQVVDELAHEGDGLFGVVDVARPILEPQDVTRLGQVSQQRIVAGIFPMMRIEPAKGPGHRRASADHRAINVDGEPGQLQARHRFGHELLIQLNQRRQGGLRELLEPVTDGARARQPGQPAEPRDQRIPGDIAEVFQPPRADVEQGQNQQRHARRTVVAGETGARCPQPLGQADASRVAAQQLEAPVRGELLPHELDAHIALDHPSQARYAQAHQRGLLCGGSDIGVFSLSITQGAFLLQMNRCSTQHLFSDWG